MRVVGDVYVTVCGGGGTHANHADSDTHAEREREHR